MLASAPFAKTLNGRSLASYFILVHNATATQDFSGTPSCTSSSFKASSVHVGTNVTLLIGRAPFTAVHSQTCFLPFFGGPDDRSTHDVMTAKMTAWKVATHGTVSASHNASLPRLAESHTCRMQSNIVIYCMYKTKYFATQTGSILKVPARTCATSSSANLTMSAAKPTPIPRDWAKSVREMCLLVSWSISKNPS